MNTREIRDTIIKAIYSDEDLVDILVLKGGNALRIHDVINRESQDLDFSIKKEIRFTQEQEGNKFYNLISEAFDKKGFLVNLYKFKDKPKSRHDNLPPFWGGYEISFTLIDKEKYQDKIQQTEISEMGDLNRYGEVLGDGTKKIQIDLSYDEYTEDKVEYDLDGTTIYLYSPLMIIYEKIRASCQQLDDYKLSSSKTRARDLYDIYTTLTAFKFVDLKEEVLSEENFDILEHIFQAKQVPFGLMTKLDSKKEDLRIDYDERVLTQIPKNDDKIDFDYIFSYNQELFNDLYNKYKNYKNI